MDFENLENMDKNEFVALGATAVKQEMVDNGIADDTAAAAAETTPETSSAGSNEINSATTVSNTPDATETNNPVCDSAEKQSDVDKSSTSDENRYKKCMFCRQVLGAKDVPKLLECLHVACSACITAKFNELDRSQTSFVLCPKCKTPSKQESVILDQFLIELSESNIEESQSSDVDAKAIKCSSCTDDAVATSWCVECAEYICDSCVQAHQRLKITKDHTIKTKEEALSDNQSSTCEEKTLMCHVHPQEKLSLFCETCDKLTCRDCQLVDHRDHKYKFANEIALETRDSLDVLLNEITYKRVLLNSAMNVIDDRQKLIADKKKELVTEITNMVVRITNTVNMRGKQLVHRLSEVCDGKLKVLNEKKEALQLLSNHTDHCIGFVKFALEKGSDSAVLFSKKTLTSHLQKVKSQRADIPNPEIPVRIQVQMNQVQELQKVISQLGTIIVDGKAYPPPVAPPAANAGIRQQPSPSNVNAVQPGITSPNLLVAQQQQQQQQQQSLQQQQPQQQVQQPPPPPPLQSQAMPAHRTNMPPPSRSPQIPANMNMRSNLYGGTTPPVQQQANFQQQSPQQACNMSRPYPQDNGIGFGRFPNMGPRPTQFRQMTPHVSSSTHPQNMEISLRGLLTQGGANQTVGQMQSGTGNDFNSLYNQQLQPQQQQPQQGLPAQGMQMGHFPSMNNQQAAQNSILAQQRRQQEMLQQQQRQIQAAHRQQMMQQSQQNRTGIPPTIPQQTMPMAAQASQLASQIAQNIAQIAQRPNMQNQTDLYMGQQMNFQPSNPPALNPVANCGTSPSSWHIPQSGRSSNGSTQNQPNQNPLSMQFCTNGRLNENSFKIALKPQNTLKQSSHNQTPASIASVPSTVTSTNPKTPSPRTHDNTKEFSDAIDKACEEQVSDLMATIAKLDSNGVQVLPEGQRGKTTSPQVSSTDYSLPTDADKLMNKEDPNEDWCAVCSDGGELMCCDKCPKVFHQHCHIPIINPFPDENEPWQCMLCYNFNDMPLEPIIGDKRSAGLSPAEHKRIQRILLELYCQNEYSTLFRDLEPETNTGYYEIIKNAITLDIIRSKLDPANPDRYVDIAAFVDDVRLLFSNVYLYYREDSKIFKNAHYLENFFEELLHKYLPDYATKRSNTNGSVRAPELKRMRTENQRPLEIIDDDDVIALA